MVKKENVNCDVKKGYVLVFTTGKDFSNSFNTVFKVLFVETIPSPIEIMDMIVFVYDNIECGIDSPVCVSDLYCHIYIAVEEDNSLRVDVREHIASYGGLSSNVI